MRPSVDRHFVTFHILLDEHLRSLNDTGTDREESGAEILLIQKVEKVSKQAFSIKYNLNVQ